MDFKNWHFIKIPSDPQGPQHYWITDLLREDLLRNTKYSIGNLLIHLQLHHICRSQFAKKSLFSSCFVQFHFQKRQKEASLSCQYSTWTWRLVEIKLKQEYLKN